jgi:hypothetical protein
MLDVRQHELARIDLRLDYSRTSRRRLTGMLAPMISPPASPLERTSIHRFAEAIFMTVYPEIAFTKRSGVKRPAIEAYCQLHRAERSACDRKLD